MKLHTHCSFLYAKSSNKDPVMRFIDWIIIYCVVLFKILFMDIYHQMTLITSSPLWGSPHLWVALLEAGCHCAGSLPSSTSGFVGRSESGSPCRDRTSASGSGLPTPGTGLLVVWPEGWVGCTTTGGLVQSHMKIKTGLENTVLIS